MRLCIKIKLFMLYNRSEQRPDNFAFCIVHFAFCILYIYSHINLFSAYSVLGDTIRGGARRYGLFPSPIGR